jgi:hypothetical protein
MYESGAKYKLRFFRATIFFDACHPERSEGSALRLRSEQIILIWSRERDALAPVPRATTTKADPSSLRSSG